MPQARDLTALTMSVTWRRTARMTPLLLGIAALFGTVGVRSQIPAAQNTVPAPITPEAATSRLFDQHCSTCHNDYDKVAGLSVDALNPADLQTGANADIWEKVLRRTSLGEMPPHSKPRPDSALVAAVDQWLEGSLDRYAAAHPDPGRATIRRLNRAEYANAVSDLLGIPVNAGTVNLADDLPPDNSGYGFDNIADVLTVSPTLLDRYVTVAGRISSLATGAISSRPFVTSYEVPKDGSILNQGRPAWNERASDDLPLASRGGGAFRYYARHDAVYEITGTLNANTNNETDREKADQVSVRVPLKAGMHTIGLSFPRSISPDETVQRLTNTTDTVVLPTAPPTLLPLDFSVDGRKVKQVQVPSYRMSPRFAQANWLRDVLQIDVTGPIAATGPGATASRRKIFVCTPSTPAQQAPCAARIIGNLAHLAYRRPVTADDLTPLMKIYAAARTDGGFDQGISAAIEGMLVSPSFLFVIERDPPGSRAGENHPLDDLALATRLSLFLWSSIPDPALLALAEQGRLHDPAVLDGQITRMLADPRSAALTRNFAGQWLYLRNLEMQRPDVTAFPAFDTRLRQAMARETELFFASVLHNNRSIRDFISADYTFLNQRLAEHYGIPGVRGTAFRKVALDPQWHRGGLLGQASILTVTSYANRTSVVKRGKWILENLLAAPPPAPPPNVPALKDKHDGMLLSARQQIELHRADPACAGCHVKMDPLGFSLENFDAVGGYRHADASGPVDVTALMPDGTSFAGADGLRAWLTAHQDQFANAFAQRLLTYALGRGLEAPDQPTVRAIARSAGADDYRIQSFIRAIVSSLPFSQRKAPAAMSASNAAAASAAGHPAS